MHCFDGDKIVVLGQSLANVLSLNCIFSTEDCSLPCKFQIAWRTCRKGENLRFTVSKTWQHIGYAMLHLWYHGETRTKMIQSLILQKTFLLWFRWRVVTEEVFSMLRIQTVFSWLLKQSLEKGTICSHVYAVSSFKLSASF